MYEYLKRLYGRQDFKKFILCSLDFNFLTFYQDHAVKNTRKGKFLLSLTKRDINMDMKNTKSVHWYWECIHYQRKGQT
jgi:hypothetical protein